MKAISLTVYLAALVLFVLTPTSNQAIAPLPASVASALASRYMRYHHLLFHNIRNQWNRLDSKTQATIRSYGWAPPRPAQDSRGRVITTNGAGEDFLYMHRTMIGVFNNLVAKAGSAPIKGFTTLPAANDPNLPMPPAYTLSGITNTVAHYKSTSWYNYMKSIETKLKSTSFLRSMTLGQFGAYMEFTADVHQGMHFRFSQYNNIIRPSSSSVIPVVSTRYDVPSANWLGDLYSSQVNPWFWKLHGWIDDRVTDWAKARGLSTIKWNNTWTGGEMGNLPKNLGITSNPSVKFPNDRTLCEEDMASTMNLTAMEEVAKLLIKQGVMCDYYSDLYPAYNTEKGTCPDQVLGYK